MLIKAGAELCATDRNKDSCLTLAADAQERHGGHDAIVHYLVGLPEVDVNHKGVKNRTALHSALMKGGSLMERALIEAGADLEAKDGRGRTPLHEAVTSCKTYVSSVERLVEAGASVRATDKDKETCLTLAAKYGDTKTVRYLACLPEVDVNHKPRDTYTALYRALTRGDCQMVEALIDAGADVETKPVCGFPPLLSASYDGNLSIVKMLVEAGASVRATDEYIDTCLTLAAEKGHTKTVRYLAGLKDVDVNHAADENKTALHSAATEGRSAMVQALINAGADIEAKDDLGFSPLLHASWSGKFSAVKKLVEAGASVCATGEVSDTCLTLAAEEGHTETVRYLVGLPEVDIEARNYHARPLFLASENGNTAIVKMLVEAGAKVCATDKEGRTCLEIASGNGHTETVSYLVGLQEVDVKNTDHQHFTALHRAVSTGHADVVQVLINAGADIEAKDRMGRSPLHWACEGGRLAIVKMLVEAGAKMCATDDEGNTCFTIAEKNGHTETVRYLEKLRGVTVKQTDKLGNTALKQRQSRALRQRRK